MAVNSFVDEENIISCDVLFLGSSKADSFQPSLASVQEPLGRIHHRASSSSSSSSSSSLAGVETRLTVTSSGIEIVNAAKTKARVAVSRVLYCCAISVQNNTAHPETASHSGAEQPRIGT